MEERAAGGLTQEPPTRHGHGRRNNSSYDDSFDYTAANGSFDEETQLDTYVVQVPKDQIYRVPPPENAIIVERHRDPTRKRKASCCTRVCWIIMIVFAIGISVGVALAILHNVYSPKGAVFSIVDAHVKNHARPGYGFTIKVKNPNEHVGIKYGRNGDALLFFRKKKLANGKFPEFEQERGDSRNVHIALTGSRKGVPAEVSKSMHDKRKEHAVSLELIMNLKGQMNLGFLKLWSKDMVVACNFKLSRGTKVSPQKCNTEIN